MTGLPQKAYYRPDEIAEYYQVSRSTVYLWIETGRLTATKIAGTSVRIPREALQEIVQEVGE